MTTRSFVRLATVTLVVAVVALLVYRAASRSRSRLAPVRVDLTFTAEPDSPAEGREDLALDARLGYRLPRRASWQVAGGERRTNDHGLVRTDDLGDEIAGPRILWLSDDLLAGVPNADSAPSLVEAALRSTGTWPEAVVLDATTPGDGLWHHALRSAALTRRYAPLMMVVCVHLDDDIVALNDPSLPERAELQAEAGTAAGVDELARLTRAAVDRLRDVAPRKGGNLLMVLTPGRATLESAEDAPARGAVDVFRQTLEEMHVSHLDLTTAWPMAEAPALYQPDGRLTPEGHRRVAGAVLARVHRTLDAL